MLFGSNIIFTFLILYENAVIIIVIIKYTIIIRSRFESNNVGRWMDLLKRVVKVPISLGL